MDRILGRKKSPNKSKEKGTSVQKFDAWLSTSEFVMNAIKGSAQIQIKISEIPEVCMALMGGLEKQGLLNQQQFEQRLHGICPNCGIRLKGSGIMMVTMINQSGRAVFGSGSASTERVSNGYCANEKCKSKDIILEWDALETSDLPFSL
jgi:hypothetical protein